MKTAFTQSKCGLWNLIYLKKKIFFLLVILAMSITGSYAQVNIVFNPSATTVNVGQSFTVDVNVQISSGNVDAVASHFNFNPAVLQVTAVSNAGSAALLPFILNPATFISNPALTISTYNTNGRVDYAATTFSSFPTSNFTLLSVTFTAIAVPSGNTTPLTFRRPPTAAPLTNASSGGSSVLSGVTNAIITVNPAGCTSPSATIANTGTCNGQAFDLVLSNATGTTDWNLIINGTPYNDISVGEVITTITPPIENIWPATTPSGTNTNDGQAVEVGIKFRSDVAGLVRGIRFFRPSAAGTYTGRLYLKTGTSTGTQMAVVTFPAAPANQWQQAMFTSPVQINANTVYVVTYHSSSGDYRVSDNYFNNVANPGVVNGHLTALAAGVDGVNGIYDHLGSGGTYPTSSFASSNYWVDPLFTPGAYSYVLTNVTDNNGCAIVGSPLQTLNITSPACSPLPVTLLDLSATPQGKNVVLNWTTSSEINNKGFEIQRSRDNVLWEGLGFVNGAGTSTIQHSYTYTDKDLFPQRYYYRLKQVDNDNIYKFSMTVTVLLTGKGEYSLKQNYPNPFNTETSIQYTIPETEKVKLTVFDVNGRTVKVLVNETRQAGTHAINFYTGRLQPGLYYYKLEAGSFSTVKKMVIQ